MLSQEEYMDVLAFKRQGMTITEIADATGYHPATIKKWLRDGGPPPKRSVDTAEVVIDERWDARITELLRPAPRLLATSVYEILRAEGFRGSYPTVVRHLRERRGPRFRSAPQPSMPIETAPGEETQFDWTDCNDWASRLGLTELHCFGAILCWSRFRTLWFTTSIDQQHTFEGLVRHFETIGGVPQRGRTDRMGALGKSQGKRFTLHPPALEFARSHGIEIKPCDTGDAKRKGKIERPFRDIKESFLVELDALGWPHSLAGLNGRAQRWLDDRLHCRPHGTTGEAPQDRLLIERRFLGALPPGRYDTAYREPRRVHIALPLVEWRGVRYSVPPKCLGQRVECRQPLADDVLEIRWAGEVVARHRLGAKSDGDVWDPRHRSETEHLALRGRRGHLRLVTDGGASAPAASRLPCFEDYDVERIDLGRYRTDEEA